MRKKYLVFLLAGCMTFSAPSMVWATEQTTEAATEAAAGEAASQAGETADTASTSGLGTDVYSFQVEYAGKLIQLPMTYDKFTALG